jgi:hypothetical protein
MIKNRLHVLAQYIRVKVPLQDITIEEILTKIIESVKYSKNEPRNDNNLNVSK